MMLLNTPPAPDESGLSDYYRRCASEGSVFSGMIENQSYGVSDSFDPAWSVAALCWCAGGTETYEFQGGETIDLKAGALLAIGENERYAYTAHGSRPFKSSMIVFPREMTDNISSYSNTDSPQQVIRTGLLKPDDKLRNHLHDFARLLRNTDASEECLEEQAALYRYGLNLGMTNHWKNLFEDRSERVAALSDESENDDVLE